MAQNGRGDVLGSEEDEDDCAARLGVDLNETEFLDQCAEVA